MLGKAQQMNISLMRWRQRGAARFQEALERAARVLGAKIAAYRALKFAQSHRGPARAQRLADEARLGANEHIGLQALDGIGGAREREADEGQHVDAEAEENAVNQLRKIDAKQGGRLQRRQTQRPVGDDAGDGGRFKRQ